MARLTLPDGKVISFPDGLSPDQVSAIVSAASVQPQQAAGGKTDRERSWSEVAGDVGLSAAQGFQSGFQSLLGAAGDAQQMAGDVAGWGAEHLGFTPETQATASNVASRFAMPFFPAQMPRTSEVNKAFESVLGGKYVPETDAGRYSRSVAEMVPGMAAGPGGVARKGLMAAATGIATQAADDATEGNPYAKVGAGLLATALTAGKGGAGTKAMLKDVGESGPAYGKVEADTNAAYSALRNAGIKYDANAVDQAIQDVSQLRLNPQLTPKAAGLRDALTEFAGKGMDFQDLDEMEQIATGIMRHHMTEPADKKFVGDILTKIKDIRQSGAVATNGSIPANEVNGLIKTAKELARRRIIARDVGKMKDKAEWYVSGPESGLRNQFRNYGKKNYQNLTDAEEKAFKSVVNREGLLNPLHNAGSRLGNIALGGAGLFAGGPVAALASVVGSSLARRFMEAYTNRGVENAIRTVLAGKDAQTKAAVKDIISREEAIARGAISSGNVVGMNLLGNQ